MMLKKYKGKVFGADFTATEKKAIDMEVSRQFSAFLSENDVKISAMILWVLHEKFGFGKQRLKKFYDSFNPSLKELADRYQMSEEDQCWLCMHQLKQYGVNIEDWASGKVER